MKSLPFKLVLIISLTLFHACSFTPADQAATELCNCLRPLSDVIDDGKTKRDKSVSDYIQLFGNGISSTGKLIGCMSELENTYEQYSRNEEWQDKVTAKARRKCPKVFRSFDEFLE